MFRKAYLEIGNICDLNCAFCPGTKRKQAFMTGEDFRLLAAKLRPYTDYLYLHLMGEPLLHPELETILGHGRELGFKLIITTNGTHLPERGELLLSAPAVHKVNISLQSLEGNGGKELETYISSCAAFAGAMGRCGKLCVLRLWNKNGQDRLNGRILELLEDRFPRPWQESRGSQRLADRVYLEPGEKFDWPEIGLQEGEEKRFCYGLRDQIGVLVDGTVVPCCLDHDGDIALGDLFSQDLKEILESPRAKALYEGFSQRRAVEPLCRRCGYSMRFS